MGLTSSTSWWASAFFPNWRSLDVLVSSLSLFASYLLLRRSQTDRRIKVDASDREDETIHSSYILPSYIHHARMLPKESTHVFKYPTLYFTLNLADLEDGGCDLGWDGRLFHWNGRKRKRAITALEAGDYLSASEESSWLKKLEGQLQQRGYLVGDQSLRHDFQTWAVTMPNFLGLHGINPLTVYYVYRKDASGDRSSLWLCLLEVHNTFSERHLYVLPAGVGEDRLAREVLPPDSGESSDWEILGESSKQKGLIHPSGDGISWPVSSRRQGYDHQWTFPRSFHVSPFNDRSGYYRLYLRDLWQPGSNLPTMDIRLLLLTEAEDEKQVASLPHLEKKLLATLSSHSHDDPQRPRAMTSGNLIEALVRQPFDLTLTFARIAYQAAKLHYGKKLNVFGKPDLSVRSRSERRQLRPAAAEPVPFDGIGWPVSTNATQIEVEQGLGGQSEPKLPNGSLYWAPPTAAQVYFCAWFKDLASQSPRIAVRLVQANGQTEVISAREKNAPTLVIYLLSHAFFSDLALYGSPSLVFLLGSRVGRRWGVNDVQLFNEFFADLPRVTGSQAETSRALRSTRALRQKHIQWARSFVTGTDMISNKDPDTLDDVPSSHSSTWTFYLHLLTMHSTSVLEYTVFKWARARYVEGDEPWLEWRRGADLVRRDCNV